MKATTTNTSVIEISLSKIQDSGANPRTSTKNDAGLEELAQSIKQHGVLQPVLVRTVNGHYELIAGARRIAGSKLAGLETIPAKVIEADDRTAAALRLVENLQRKDLNAIEEAEGFSRLIKEHEYSAEEVAESSAKSLQYVRQRMKLVDLPDSAKKALRSGSISPAMGLVIARIPDKKQRERASKEITHQDQWRGGMTLKEAKNYVEREFMLELSRAPFKTDDESLVPAAGSCLNCPKRTGNQADLFADVQKDSCTDAACFNGKKKAHFDRVLADARDKGLRVATGKEAERIDRYDSGYVNLNDRNYDDPKSQTWRKLLGDKCPEKTVALIESKYANDRDEVKEFVSKKDAIAALKAKGFKWAEDLRATPSGRGRSNADKAREKKLRLQQKVSQQAIAQIITVAENNDTDDEDVEILRTIVLSCLERYGADVNKRIAKRRELPTTKHSWGGEDFHGAVKKLAKELDYGQLYNLLIEIVAQHDYPQGYSTGYGKRLGSLAKHHGVNLSAIEKQLAKEQPAKKVKKAVKK